MVIAPVWYSFYSAAVLGREQSGEKKELRERFEKAREMGKELVRMERMEIDERDTIPGSRVDGGL